MHGKIVQIMCSSIINLINKNKIRIVLSHGKCKREIAEMHNPLQNEVLLLMWMQPAHVFNYTVARTLSQNLLFFILI